MSEVLVFSVVFQMIMDTFLLNVKMKGGKIETMAIYILKLRTAIGGIREAYKEENRKTSVATAVQYDNIFYRFAYVFLYLTSHVNIIKKIMINFWPCIKIETRNWITNVNTKKLMKICCIGGGPATDLFGLMAFFRSGSFVDGSVCVEAKILDKFTEWKETADELNQKLKRNNSLKLKEISYLSFNFFELSDAGLVCISEADIVTMVKFISAVAANKNTCSQQLQKILKNVKSGSLVLFIENVNENTEKLFATEATKADLVLLKELKNKQCSLSETNKKDIISKSAIFFMEDEQHRPQRESRVSASIWKKK